MQSLRGLSVVAQHSGDIVNAREFSERHFAMAMELEDKDESSLAQASLAKITYAEGRIVESESHLHYAIDLAPERGGRVIEMLNLALFYAEQKRFVEAVQLSKSIQVIIPINANIPPGFFEITMKLQRIWQEEI